MTRNILDLSRSTTVRPVSLSEPSGAGDDPLVLLENDPEKAYAVIENLLVDPMQVGHWSSRMRLYQQGSTQHLMEGLITAIVHHGVRAACQLGKASDAALAALLRNPDYLVEAHTRIWGSDSAYWQPRLERDPNIERQGLPLNHPSPSKFALILEKVGSPVCKIWKTPLVQQFYGRIALCLAVLFLVAGAWKAKEYYDRLEEFRQLERTLGLHEYVLFDGDNKNLSLSNPKRFRPLLTAGHDVFVKGTTQANLVRAIRIYEQPTLPEGEAILVEEILITAKGNQQIVPFEWHFDTLEPGPTRLITVELVPREEAKDILRHRILKFPVLVVAEPDGAKAYIENQVPEIESIEPIGTMNRVLVTVRSRTHHSGLLGVTWAAAGGEIAGVTPIRHVSRFGQRDTYEISLGSGSMHTLQAFATNDRSKLSLVSLLQQNLNGVLVSEPKTIRIGSDD